MYISDVLLAKMSKKIEGIRQISEKIVTFQNR